MTMPRLHDPHHTGEPLAWKQAADDVFVATHAGEFAGFVTIDGHRHFAHDRHSLPIGEYASLAAALGVLEERAKPASAAARVRSTRTRRRARSALV
ncbi:hypothetical protein GCM10022219_10510 [Microbacterium oryzae]|uniref:Uncharacterized protein n=1 Tax=Microbacterium oryzae TaxID=743009 RepID=A0A6I6DWM2_9MICO|nr:hypothetical protein [Microbacterium oryzae]QGU28566.1 hypothetical protein D7D94_13470 [Microbacterium oryzae]